MSPARAGKIGSRISATAQASSSPPGIVKEYAILRAFAFMLSRAIDK